MNLIKAYGRAETTVKFAEEKASSIAVSHLQTEAESEAGIPLDPTLSHALFMSGKSDEAGDLMNKLALINLETMKLVQKKGRTFFENI